jgi:hypothetical protein
MNISNRTLGLIFVAVAALTFLASCSRATRPADAADTIFVFNSDATPQSVVFTDAEVGTITATLTRSLSHDTSLDCLEVDMIDSADEIVVPRSASLRTP